MERYTWKAKLKPGMLEEYIKRHGDIWPELRLLLLDAGIRNYTIWNSGDLLFGYYECLHGVEYAAKKQADSEIVRRWNEYMKDVMEMELDPVTGAQPLMARVFELSEDIAGNDAISGAPVNT